MSKTFSQMMEESDQTGDTHGMSTTTYWRARSIWQARISPDTDLASKARKVIPKIESGETTLSAATKELGIESKYPTRSQAPTIQAIRRIAATLEALEQVMSGIRSPKSVRISPNEATELAEQIIQSCRAISRTAAKLKKAGQQ